MNDQDVVALLASILSGLRQRPESPEAGILLALQAVSVLHRGTTVEKLLGEIHGEYQLCIAK